MTLIVAVIPELNSGQALTKVRIYCFLAITQIPDQVRNDGTAVVILTKVRICLILNQVQNDANRGRHS